MDHPRRRLGVSAGAGLVLWFGLQHTLESALINVLISMAITEVQIFTQPMRAVSDWKTYAEKYDMENKQAFMPEKQNWYVMVGFDKVIVGTNF